MQKIIVLDVDMAEDIIHPVVLQDESSCVLVDCGYAGSLPKIEAALRVKGIEPEAITHILLTHQDHDHVGAAAAFKRSYQAVSILASKEELPYISGAMKSLRLKQAEELQSVLPPEQQAFGEAFCGLLRSVEPVEVDCALQAGEVLPFCGGCEVLATPGHTPGHISLYLPQLHTLICGDAMALENRAPVIANPQFTLDLEKAEKSLQGLLARKGNRFICYHGGVLDLPG